MSIPDLIEQYEKDINRCLKSGLSGKANILADIILDLTAVLNGEEKREKEDEQMEVVDWFPHSM